MQRLVGVFVLMIAATTASGQLAVRYDGERVVRVVARDEAQLEQILALTDDVWSHETGVGPLDIRVDALQQAALDAAQIPYRVLIDDVQRVIDAQALQASGARGLFDQYLPLAEVRARLAALETQNPALVDRITFGNSVQNRPLEAIRITGPGDTSQRPSIVIHGGQHAREWITVAVALYVADRLVTTYDSDPVVRALVDRIDWYILPVMNPDGYEYTWTNDRMWRKNRRQNSGGSRGVDLNATGAWGGAARVRADRRAAKPIAVRRRFRSRRRGRCGISACRGRTWWVTSICTVIRRS